MEMGAHHSPERRLHRMQWLRVLPGRGRLIHAGVAAEHLAPVADPGPARSLPPSFPPFSFPPARSSGFFSP